MSTGVIPPLVLILASRGISHPPRVCPAHEHLGGVSRSTNSSAFKVMRSGRPSTEGIEGGQQGLTTTTGLGRGQRSSPALFHPPSWATSPSSIARGKKKAWVFSVAGPSCSPSCSSPESSGSSGWPGSLFPGSVLSWDSSVQIQERTQKCQLLTWFRCFSLVMLEGCFYFILYAFCWDITDRNA